MPGTLPDEGGVIALSAGAISSAGGNNSITITNVTAASGGVLPYGYSGGYRLQSLGGAYTFVPLTGGSGTISGLEPGVYEVLRRVYDAASSSADTEVQVVTVTGTSLAPSFTIALAATSKTLNAGASVTDVLTITRVNGHNAAVTTSVSSLPPGVTGGAAPSPTTGGSSTVTLTADAGALNSETMVMVSATDGTITRSAYIDLTVVQAPPTPGGPKVADNNGINGTAGTAGTNNKLGHQGTLSGTQTTTRLTLAAVPTGCPTEGVVLVLTGSAKGLSARYKLVGVVLELETALGTAPATTNLILMNPR